MPGLKAKETGLVVAEGPTVYCVIPVHNRLEITKRFLGCLLGQDYVSVQIIIVDDGSTDGTGEYLAQSGLPNLTVITGNGNLWWGGAMRLGMKHVLEVARTEDFLLMINDDVYIEAGYVKHLVEESKLHGRAVIGSLQCGHTGRMLASGYHINYWTMQIIPAEVHATLVDCLPGRGALYPMEAVRQCGLVHSTIFPHYFGDIEYAARAKEMGWPLVISKKARVFTSTESSDAHIKRKGFIYRYLAIRSKDSLVQRLMFFSLRGPWVLRLIALPRYVICGLWRLSCRRG